MSEEVLVDVADHVATITLNAPERMNTISGPMLETLSRELVAADRDPEVRAIVVTGAGRAFCAGLDLRAQSGGGGLAVGTSPGEFEPAMRRPSSCTTSTPPRSAP
jgi:enoyl-CoA hydratase/carnithine racemase